jgi:DNA-binding IclR family transcriptional regulator
VRALFPDRTAFVSRTSQGPTSLSALTSMLAHTRQRGHGTESGEVTPGLSSVAVAVHDHVGYPVAAVAVTYESRPDAPVAQYVHTVGATAKRISQRLGGHRP